MVVDTFAYQYTRQAPTGITARDNVCVRLCSIECCFAHALNDPDCEFNAKFMKDLEDWSKICSRLYVWDYVTNFMQTLCVFPNFDVLRSNIDTFRSHSVVGIYEEGAYYADPAGTEFYYLRSLISAAPAPATSRGICSSTATPNTVYTGSRGRTSARSMSCGRSP